MTHPVNHEPFTPWYREPWVWAILGLLLTTFVWGSYRIYYAFKIQDSVVVDDYYKSGKAINQDLTRDQNARDLNISAQLYIDDLIGEVRVTVLGDVDQWPSSLKLSLLSPPSLTGTISSPCSEPSATHPMLSMSGRPTTQRPAKPTFNWRLWTN